MINENIQVNLIDNISKQQLHINRLQNIKKSQQIVQYVKQVYTNYQNLTYCYDFETYKILDFAGLSSAIKQSTMVI